MDLKKLFFTSVDMFDNAKTTVFFHNGDILGTIELLGAGEYDIRPVGKTPIKLVGIDNAIKYLVNLKTGPQIKPVTVQPVQPTLF